MTATHSQKTQVRLMVAQGIHPDKIAKELGLTENDVYACLPRGARYGVKNEAPRPHGKR